MKYKIYYLIFLVYIVFNLSSCQKRIHKGHFVDTHMIQKLREGNLKKDDVIKLIGPPTITDNSVNNSWYYVYALYSSNCLRYKLIESKTVSISFKNGFLENVNLLRNEWRNDISPLNKVTTSKFQTEKNIVDLFLGNLLKFNKKNKVKLRHGSDFESYIKTSYIKKKSEGRNSGFLDKFIYRNSKNPSFKDHSNPINE